MLFSRKSIETLKQELRYAQDNNLIEYYIDVRKLSIVPSVGTPSDHNMLITNPYLSIRLLPNTTDSKKSELIRCLVASYDRVKTVCLTTSGASIEIHYDQE